MGIVIDYSLLPGLEKTGILDPMIPIIFRNGKREISTMALVDSGAEAGIISTVIADRLKIKWRKTPAKTGFSVGSSFFFHPVNITATIYNHSFSFKANVVEGIFAFKCILGRNDLFKRAKICFVGHKNQFEIIFREFN